MQHTYIWAQKQSLISYNFVLDSNFQLFTAHLVCGKNPKTFEIRGQLIKKSGTQMVSLSVKNAAKNSHAWAPVRANMTKLLNYHGEFRPYYMRNSESYSNSKFIRFNDLKCIRIPTRLLKEYSFCLSHLYWYRGVTVQYCRAGLFKSKCDQSMQVSPIGRLTSVRTVQLGRMTQFLC